MTVGAEATDSTASLIAATLPQHRVGGLIPIRQAGRDLGLMTREPAAVHLESLDLGRGHGLGAEQEARELLKVVIGCCAEGPERPLDVDHVRREVRRQLQRQLTQRIRYVGCVLARPPMASRAVWVRFRAPYRCDALAQPVPSSALSPG